MSLEPDGSIQLESVPDNVDMNDLDWIRNSFEEGYLDFQGRQILVRPFESVGAEFGLTSRAYPPEDKEKVTVYHGGSLINIPSIFKYGLLSSHNTKTVGFSTRVPFVSQRARDQKIACPATGNHIAVVTAFKTNHSNIDWSGNEGGNLGLALSCPNPPMDIIHSYSTMSHSRAENIVYLPPGDLVGIYLVLYGEDGRTWTEDFTKNDF